MKTSVRLLVLAAVLVLLISTVGPAGAKPAKTVDVQILALNDFHGNLLPVGGSSGSIGGIPAGGVEYLATHVNNLRATNPNTVFVAAGDLIGASPLISALFHDEPTIEAFNLMGLDFHAVGNHEFDEGINELIRMQEGGCHPAEGCLDGDDFAGADFRFLAANVTWKKNDKTIFPAFKTKSFKGVHIAFIGMTLEGTPTIVSQSGIADLNFKDEADTVNALIPELKKRGIETIVVVIHEGGFPTGDFNECPGISGPIVDIVNRTDDEVDLFITGHTHQAYNCVIDGRLVTSAASFGRLVTDIDLTIDFATGEMLSATANNHIVTREVPPDPSLTTLLSKYAALVAPLTNRVVGTIGADFTRTVTPAGESPLGRLIADAQLAATADPASGGAVVAFMNPGGIRADLRFDLSTGEQPGEVTYGEAFTVQPFGNTLVTMTLTGTQIDELLEQQATAGSDGQGRILQVSNGFTYSYSMSAPVGQKVPITSIQINGGPIDPNASYRVTVNSFLADGGDGFTVLLQGTDRLVGIDDLEALLRYFAANPFLFPSIEERIFLIP